MQGHLKVSTRMLGFRGFYICFPDILNIKMANFAGRFESAGNKLNQTEHIETLQNETYREKESEKEQEKRDEEVPQKAEPTNIPTKKEPQEKKVKRNRTAKKCGETAESEKKEKQSLLQKIKYTYQTMCDKIKVLLEKKEKLTEFLAEPIHKAAWGRLKKELFRILRLLRPRKFTGAVRFGLEDPYDTGGYWLC